MLFLALGNYDMRFPVLGNSPLFLTLGSKKGERVHNELECGMMTMCTENALYGEIKQIHNVTVVKDIDSKGTPSFRRFTLHYDRSRKTRDAQTSLASSDPAPSLLCPLLAVRPANRKGALALANTIGRTP